MTWNAISRSTEFQASPVLLLVADVLGVAEFLAAMETNYCGAHGVKDPGVNP